MLAFFFFFLSPKQREQILSLVRTWLTTLLQYMLHFRASNQEEIVRRDGIACPICLIELAVAEKNIVKSMAS